MKEIDIILITYNHLELTIQALNALYQYNEIPFRLTVVDDSTDLTPEFFKSFCQQHPNVQFIHEGKWIDSFNKKVNIGLKNTDHEFVVIMGNSIFAEPYWLNSAMLLMEHDANVGIIGIKLLNPHGTIQHAGIGFNDGLPYNIGYGEPGHRRTYVKKVRAVIPTLSRRSALPKELDTETYIGFIGFDDIDICLEVRQRGWEIMYCGFGSAYHPASITRFLDLNQVQQVKFWEDYEENKRRFLHRWQDSLNAETGWVEG